MDIICDIKKRGWVFLAKNHSENGLRQIDVRLFVQFIKIIVFGYNVVSAESHGFIFESINNHVG